MTGGSFRRQHHRVGAIKNGIGHIIGLSTSRARVIDHRFQHLGGGDHRLTSHITFVDHGFLHDRHILWRGLHPQITACHHDGIRYCDNLIDMPKGFWLLDLGDDRQLATMRGQHQFDQFLDIGGFAHERQRHIIQVMLEGELQIMPVLFRNRGNLQLDIWQIDAFTWL